MKAIILNGILAILVVVFFGTTMFQCHRKVLSKKEVTKVLNEKAVIAHKYLTLLEAKTLTDTLYKEGKTQTVHHTVFKTITDTFKVVGTDTLKLFEDTLNRPDLRLKAKFWASKFDCADYEYNVTEKVIIQNHVTTDTVTNTIIEKKRHLYGLADVGLESYSVGLQYQGKKRLGATYRHQWIDNRKYHTFGISYRIF